MTTRLDAVIDRIEDPSMTGNIAYCVSKGGAEMLTRTAGVELASLGTGPSTSRQQR